MKRVTLIWIGMMLFMFFGLAFVKVQINPFLWAENARMSFFLLSGFGFILSFIFNELFTIGKKDK